MLSRGRRRFGGGGGGGSSATSGGTESARDVTNSQAPAATASRAPVMAATRPTATTAGASGAPRATSSRRCSRPGGGSASPAAIHCGRPARLTTQPALLQRLPQPAQRLLHPVVQRRRRHPQQRADLGQCHLVLTVHQQRQPQVVGQRVDHAAQVEIAGARMACRGLCGGAWLVPRGPTRRPSRRAFDSLVAHPHRSARSLRAPVRRRRPCSTRKNTSCVTSAAVAVSRHHRLAQRSTPAAWWSRTRRSNSAGTDSVMGHWRRRHQDTRGAPISGRIRPPGATPLRQTVVALGVLTTRWSSRWMPSNSPVCAAWRDAGAW